MFNIRIFKGVYLFCTLVLGRIAMKILLGKDIEMA